MAQKTAISNTRLRDIWKKSRRRGKGVELRGGHYLFGSKDLAKKFELAKQRRVIQKAVGIAIAKSENELAIRHCNKIQRLMQTIYITKNETEKVQAVDKVIELIGPKPANRLMELTREVFVESIKKMRRLNEAGN